MQPAELGELLRTDVDLLHDLGAEVACHGEAVDLDDVVFLLPLLHPRQIVCVGLNYRDHAQEVGLEVLTTQRCSPGSTQRWWTSGNRSGPRRSQISLITRESLSPLQDAFPPERDTEDGNIRAAAVAENARDSQLKVVQATQYALYVAFQALTFALAAAVTVSLVIAIWRVTAHPDMAQTIESGVVGLGVLVTGGAAGFVGRQAPAAKKRYDDTTRARSGKKLTDE